MAYPDFVMFLTGRSNSVGNQTTAGYTTAGENVLMWNGVDDFIQCVDPTLGGTGASCWPAFGNAFYTATGLSIGFVQKSVNGIGNVAYWSNGIGDTYYDAFLSDVSTVGQIDGLIMWCEDHDYPSVTYSDMYNAACDFADNVANDVSATLKIGVVNPYWVAAAAGDNTAAWEAAAGVKSNLELLVRADNYERVPADSVHLSKAGQDAIGAKLASKFVAKRIKHNAETIF